MSSSRTSIFGNRPEPWELRGYPEPDAVAGDDSDGGEPSIEDMTPEECSSEFMNLIVHLKLSGVISAKHACVLSYWAKGAGLCAPGSALALSPTHSGGAFSKHFDKVVGVGLNRREMFHELTVPVFERWSFSRSTATVQANWVHLQLAEEVRSLPNFWDQVDSECRSAGWASRYDSHPLVRAHGRKKLIPLGVYVDGVPFLKRDSAIGFWFINLATGRRFLALALRKRQLCACGCRGWCSLFVAFEYLRWQCATMLPGVHPPSSHDGAPWPDDHPREADAGQPLPYFAAVLMVKADWAEFCHTIGYPNWMHAEHPCFLCFCTGGSEGTFGSTEGVSVLSLPWGAKDKDAYDRTCATAEQRVTIASPQELQVLLGHLEYDQRKGSRSEGRCLAADLPGMGLLKHDRLDPTLEHPDIGAIDARVHDAPFRPLQLVFWRTAVEVFCKHRNPLFHESTGITPESLCVDEMHTMHLGVYSIFISHCLWAIIAANVWTFDGGKEQVHVMGAHRIRHELFAWYKRTKRADPENPVYELVDFVLKTRNHPNCSPRQQKPGRC